MALRYDNGMSHCVEASQCAAAVLRRFKVKTARAMPCGVIMHRDGKGATIGHNAKSLYDIMRPSQPFEEWKPAYRSVVAGEFPFHVIVEATHSGDRALLDLTLGQLRKTAGYPAPINLAAYEKDWPTLDVGDGYSVMYTRCPYPDRLDPRWRDFKNLG